MILNIILTFLLLTLENPLISQSSGVQPMPRAFYSRGSDYVAEIFTATSRLNRTFQGGAICYFYRTYMDHKTDAMSYRLLWQRKLVNPCAPWKAYVSMNGLLVTIDDANGLGRKHAVVLYNKEGRLLKSFHLDELFTADEADVFPHSNYSRIWNDQAQYFFLTNPDRFYILLKSGVVLQFLFSDASFQKGTIKDFADFEFVTKKTVPNEQTHLWEIDLRFSSITELVDCRKHTKRSLKGAGS